VRNDMKHQNYFLMKNILAFASILMLLSACSPKVSTQLPERKPKWETPQTTKTEVTELPEIPEIPEAPEEATPPEPVRQGAFEVNAIPAAPMVVVGLKREPCYGRCPSYEVKLYDDGTIKYNGKAHVKNIGYYIAYTSKQAIVNIQTKAEEIGYFGMKRQYPASGQPQMYDVPQVTTFIKISDREHRITNRHEGPSALFKLEDYIEQQLENLDWKSIRYDEF